MPLLSTDMVHDIPVWAMMVGGLFVAILILAGAIYRQGRGGKDTLLVYRVCIKPACAQANDNTFLPVAYPKTDHPLDRWMR